MESYELLHCFFPGGENIFFGPLCTESFRIFLVKSRAPDVSGKVSQ